jgi:hypothetical protein
MATIPRPPAPPANQNVSLDTVQHTVQIAFKMTSDRGVPNQPTVMAGNKGTPPPKQPPQPSRQSSGPPTEPPAVRDIRSARSARRGSPPPLSDTPPANTPSLGTLRRKAAVDAIRTLSISIKPTVATSSRGSNLNKLQRMAVEAWHKLATAVLSDENHIPAEQLQAAQAALDKYAKEVEAGGDDAKPHEAPLEALRDIETNLDVWNTFRSPASTPELDKLKITADKAITMIEAIKKKEGFIPNWALNTAQKAINNYAVAVRAGGPAAEAHRFTLNALQQRFDNVDPIKWPQT